MTRKERPPKSVFRFAGASIGGQVNSLSTVIRDRKIGMERYRDR
jgi:hypothetical protein